MFLILLQVIFLIRVSQPKVLVTRMVSKFPTIRLSWCHFFGTYSFFLRKNSLNGSNFFVYWVIWCYTGKNSLYIGWNFLEWSEILPLWTNFLGILGWMRSQQWCSTRNTKALLWVPKCLRLVPLEDSKVRGFKKSPNALTTSYLCYKICPHGQTRLP